MIGVMFDHELRERGRAFGTIRSRALTINKNIQDGVVTLSDVIGSAAAIQKSLDLYKQPGEEIIKLYSSGDCTVKILFLENGCAAVYGAADTASTLDQKTNHGSLKVA